jgi:hypothetical protein
MNRNETPYREPFEEEGIPDLEGPLREKEMTGDGQEGIVLPRDHPVAADEYGTTADEQHRGEPLDLRLSREEPDVLDALEEDDGGRLRGDLLAEDVDVDAVDGEKDLVAVETDEVGLGPEMGAMHIEPEQ